MPANGEQRVAVVAAQEHVDLSGAAVQEIKSRAAQHQIDTQAAIQNLPAGVTLTDTITVTTADGTTHEMNVKHEDNSPFNLGGMTITGLDADEEALFYFADAYGTILGSVAVTADDLDASNVLEFTNANDVIQFSVEAGAGDEFFIDDIFFI